MDLDLDENGVLSVSGGNGDKIEVVVDITKETVTSGDVSIADVLTIMKNEGWGAVNVRLENNGKPMNFYNSGAYYPNWFKLYYFALKNVVAGDGAGTVTPKLIACEVVVDNDGTVKIEEKASFVGTEL